MTLLAPVTQAQEEIEKILSRLSLEEKIGQLIMASVVKASDGSPSEETEKLIKKLKVGSLLFYDFPDPVATARYTNKLQRWAEDSSSGLPVLVASDFEYGPRTNIDRGVTTFPQQMALGATGQPEFAHAAAAATAREGRSMGVHWNLAPVADVNTNPDNPVIGVRSFGSDPDQVSKFVRAAVRGYQENEMIATLKHYPGHGDTATDSHYGLPKVEYGRSKLRTHLQPFKAGIEAGAGAVMTAHIVVEVLDPDLPATMSEKIIADLLRGRQGFDGVVLTDALNMGGIEKHFGKAEAAVGALKAGVDVVMSVGDYRDALQVRNGILEAVRSGEISISHIDNSVKRVLALKRDYGLLEEENMNNPLRARSLAGSSRHRKTARSIAQKAVTLIRDQNDLLPLKESTDKVLLVGVKDSVYRLRNELKWLSPDLDLSVYRTTGAKSENNWSPSNTDISRALQLALGADRVVLLTFSGSRLPQGQIKLARKMIEKHSGTTVVAEGLPYDIRHFPQVSTYIANYGYNRWNAPRDGQGLMTETTARVLLGRVEPKGELPVALKGLLPAEGK